jgi:pantothenate kinase
MAVNSLKRTDSSRKEHFFGKPTKISYRAWNEIQVLPADWFLTERKTRNEYAKRVKAGQSHIGDYYQWSYEIPRFLDLLKQVRNLLNAGINKIINVPNTYLRKDGSKNGNEKLTLSDKTIVIVEGVGVVIKQQKFILIYLYFVMLIITKRF